MITQCESFCHSTVIIALYRYFSMAINFDVIKAAWILWLTSYRRSDPQQAGTNHVALCHENTQINLGIIKQLGHCKCGNFTIHIWAWFGYFICPRREIRFYLFGKEYLIPIWYIYFLYYLHHIAVIWKKIATKSVVLNFWRCVYFWICGLWKSRHPCANDVAVLRTKVLLISFSPDVAK